MKVDVDGARQQQLSRRVDGLAGVHAGGIGAQQRNPPIADAQVKLRYARLK